MRVIGKNIRDLRIQKNMTQDELAEKLFVTRQTVSNYETGKSRPDIEMLERIAEVLDADIRQVLYGGQNPAEKEKRKRLIIGGALTAMVAIGWLFFVPYAQQIRGRFYVAGPMFAQYFFILPLFFLFLGWTLAHLTGMALKKEPLSTKWATICRWVLLSLILFYFFMVISYLVPYLIGEYQFIHATGDRSLSDYLHIPTFADFFIDILFSMFFARFTPEITSFTLPIGALLWLFGFPKVRPSDKNI